MGVANPILNEDVAIQAAWEIPGLSGGQFLDLLKKNAGPLRGVYFSPAFTRQAPKKGKEGWTL